MANTTRKRSYTTSEDTAFVLLGLASLLGVLLWVAAPAWVPVWGADTRVRPPDDGVMTAEVRAMPRGQLEADVRTAYHAIRFLLDLNA